MKNLFEKKFNKTIIGVVLGTAVLGLGGFGMSPKGRGFFKRMKDKTKKLGKFLKDGYKELKITTKNQKKKFKK